MFSSCSVESCLSSCALKSPAYNLRNEFETEILLSQVYENPLLTLRLSDLVLQIWLKADMVSFPEKKFQTQSILPT